MVHHKIASFVLFGRKAIVLKINGTGVVLPPPLVLWKNTTILVHLQFGKILSTLIVKWSRQYLRFIL